MFENYVLTELLKMGYSPRFWRTKAKAEVDFVVDQDGVPVPIKVKLRPRAGVASRSLRSFIKT